MQRVGGETKDGGTQELRGEAAEENEGTVE